MAASALFPSGGLIDPTKDYPIILGDQLAGGDTKPQSRLINIQYNYKTKSASSQQRTHITRSAQCPDLYNLTITDKAPNADSSVITYSYKGSVDPEHATSESRERNLVLVFDPDRKVFVLESVATQLNFNLRSAPNKTEKQVTEQYVQLRTLHDDDQGSGDDGAVEAAADTDDGPADDSNPYDYRHFLPKENADDDKSVSDGAMSAHLNASKANTPLMTAAAKPTPSPQVRPKPQTNPLRRQPRPSKPSKNQTKAAPKTNLEPPAQVEREEPQEEEIEEVEEIPAGEMKSSPSDTGTELVSSFKAAPSPGSNIIIDGDLIIDMGSPPPSRPAFRVNPAHFSSNNTPGNEEDDEDEEMETLRLPSPVGRGGASSERVETAPATQEEIEDDDDALAAEMEAAFEEEARKQEYQPPSLQYHVPSDDESEVSEEE
ncbi:hypothetical protein ALT_1774 [Aspergillus lentulus]|uniref:Transcription elongation factor Eaf N-terminal domain-containing protein n=1 Tax=Aspergillus lentulus TaxID=293939 RepID=A0AAN4PDN9_ASPLE|nr:uncharacterized protein IFM58399_04812 [Aspergillus lentulus]KAF4158200.1 hypothetical protein CNMCM6069_004400 [Aspergillus lentulus]KAF4164810.1 hypothetical protein CNMCM6936_008570 [Aspergillus lentulus]KAF4170844.1 hypothetical protein CNMCM8060_004209 [Aspergillus lentulus]KAF4180063.1 hypothetical protein CNMCM7927_001491 [Aspergillus lentulus]KAF4190784.1 hypothetical protein CNMCM8694_002915 [Aspergillus lentulus]